MIFRPLKMPEKIKSFSFIVSKHESKWTQVIFNFTHLSNCHSEDNDWFKKGKFTAFSSHFCLRGCLTFGGNFPLENRNMPRKMKGWFFFSSIKINRFSKFQRGGGENNRNRCCHKSFISDTRNVPGAGKWTWLSLVAAVGKSCGSDYHIPFIPGTSLNSNFQATTIRARIGLHVSVMHEPTLKAFFTVFLFRSLFALQRRNVQLYLNGPKGQYITASDGLLLPTPQNNPSQHFLTKLSFWAPRHHKYFRT